MIYWLFLCNFRLALRCMTTALAFSHCPRNYQFIIILSIHSNYEANNFIPTHFSIQPSPNQIRFEYTSDWFNSGTPGYLINPEVTRACDIATMKLRMSFWKVEYGFWGQVERFGDTGGAYSVELGADDFFDMCRERGRCGRDMERMKEW